MKKDFKNTIQEKDQVLVLFYASWCPFSRRFLPIFREYSETSSRDCISVNRDESPEVCTEYSIKYYPTVILFKNGKVQKRLDSKPGIGLNRKQFEDFTS
jgi:thioredoxin 1